MIINKTENIASLWLEIVAFAALRLSESSVELFGGGVI